MYIKDLNILSFGKFKDKKISFDDGFNIIYGENEAGKSTIHKFIESMFYGIYLSNKKNRIFSKDYYKYLPWDSDTYKGILKYKVNDNNYRIERDFLKEKEYVKVLDEITGKDISKSIKYNKNTRLIEPGVESFGMNHTVFNNTINIGQLSSKTDEQLIKEVKDKIINLSKSKNESISVKNVLSYLNHKKDEIGTKNRKKSPLGQSTLRLNRLKEERKTIFSVRSHIFSRAKEIKESKEELLASEETVKEINKILKDQEHIALRNKYIKTEKIIKEIEILSEQIEENKKYSDISREEYEDTLKTVSLLKQLNLEIDDIRKNCIEANDRISKIKSNIISSEIENNDIENLNTKYQIYNLNKNKINSLEKKINIGFETDEKYSEANINDFLNNYSISVKNEKNIEKYTKMINSEVQMILKKKLKKEKMRRLFNVLGGLIFLSSTALSAYAAYVYNNIIFYAGCTSILLSMILIVKSSRNNKLIKNLKIEITEVIDEQLALKENIDNLTLRNNIIYRRYGGNNIEKLRDKYTDYLTRKKVLDEKKKLLDYDKEELRLMNKNNKIIESQIQEILDTFGYFEITNENIENTNKSFKENNLKLNEISKEESLLNDLKSRTEKLSKEIHFEEKRLKIILNKNRVKDIDEFKIAVEKSSKTQEIIKEKRNKKILLESVLDGHDYETLKKQHELSREIIQPVANVNKTELIERIEDENERIKQIRDRISKYYGEIEKQENEHRNLSDVNDEIEYYEDKISIYEEKLAAIDMAHEKIVEISDNIHNSFVPTLNSSISENFSNITEGKYKNVKIDDKMNITLIEPKSDHMTSIDSLSGGTVDQIYFALRFSLSKLMSNNLNVPLILDDCFAQYDCNRLSKVIQMIHRESKRRQILLFTCHNREVDIANQLELKYKYIEL